MKDCLDILVIDDDEVDRMNVQHLLDKEGVKAVVHEASDCKSGIEKMKSREIDCVLIDYRLPDANGVEVLEKLTEVNRNNVPLILLTGMGDELLVAEAMKKGASETPWRKAKNLTALSSRRYRMLYFDWDQTRR